MSLAQQIGAEGTFDSIANHFEDDYNDSWSPAGTTGIVYWGETDLNNFPTAITTATVPLVDGNMESVDTVAWSYYNYATLSKQTTSPHSGIRNLRATYNGTGSGGCYQTVLTAGQKYHVTGWYRTDGTCTAVAEINNTDATTTSTNWTYFDFTKVAAGTRAYFYSNMTSAGQWVEFDDIKITATASQLTDLTGLGHNLVQAVAANQPIYKLSEQSGYLNFDGVANYLKAVAFTLNQPTHIFLLCTGAGGYLYDGNTASSQALYYSATNIARMYAGKPGSSVTTVAGTWCIIDAIFNGASSCIGINGGALSAFTDAGASNAGGFTLGARGSNNSFSTTSVAGIMAYNAVQPETIRQRIIQYLRTKAYKAGVVIP